MSYIGVSFVFEEQGHRPDPGGRSRHAHGRVDKGLQPFRGATLARTCWRAWRRRWPRWRSTPTATCRSTRRWRRCAGAAGLLDGFAGPLAGLQIGLQFCPTELLLTAPCDSPFFPATWPSAWRPCSQGADMAMAVTMERDPAAGRRAVTASRIRVRAAESQRAAALEAYLDTGARRMEGFSTRCGRVLFDDCAAFSNINTLEDCSTTNATRSTAARRTASQR
jgi:molybdopterin molybdotransferase